MRFGAETARYDWAGLTTGNTILGAGGFTITFDWTTTDNTDNEWIAWKVGTVNADSAVNVSTVDHVLLMRKNGGNQRFDNGADLGFSGVTFPTISGGGTYPVSLTYSFSSFADGSTVNLLASVNVGYRLLPQLELFARAENLFDADYQDVVGYNTPGRTIHAGLRVALGN